MHPTLELLDKELAQLAAQVTSAIPSNEPLNVAHGNWSFPGVTRDELVQEATNLRLCIEQNAGDVLGPNEALLADYGRRLTFLRGNTVPQIWGGNAANAVVAYLTTLNCLKIALEAAFTNKDSKTIEEQKIEVVKSLKRLQKPLRAIEARLSDLDTRSGTLNEMVAAIEQAHETADQLPTDLESLKELRKTLDALLNESSMDRATIGEKLSEIAGIRAKLESSNGEAIAILGRCNEAYRTTTSEGLASAFSERAKKLNDSMWIWVGGLIVALVSGAFLGSNQLYKLADAIKTPAQNDAGIWINLLLALLSVGAPVWFAWISTKQIGQRFRLSEDYGYKASISKAYEGYRREAALLDPSFQARLFSTALTRLDEIPLRLVETETHGSPWHELASSELVRQAIDTVPGFVDQVTTLAKQILPSSQHDKKSSKSEPVAPKEE